MPIKPANRARYPDDWREIRAAILARARNRCEGCGVANKSWILRRPGSNLLAGTTKTQAEGRVLYHRLQAAGVACAGPIKVVLTIAHVNHVVEDCSHENLRSWCQRCHLLHDKGHHAANARATRLAKLKERHALRAASELFGPTEG